MLSTASYSLRRPLISRWTLFSMVSMAFVALTTLVQSEPLTMYGYGYNQGGDRIRHDSLEFYAPSDRGCAMCRNGENCSIAIHNVSAGVFCGDVLSTFQPCCCAFRNECMTTIFSDSCECFDGTREEEIMTTRFYLFVGLSVVAWALLVYDRMCAGPYKVMNSNHQLLASSPSAARTRGEDSIVDTVNSDLEDEQTDTQNSDATTSTAAAAATATAVAIEVDGEAEDEDESAPLRPDSLSPTTEAVGSRVEVEPPGANERQEQNETSIQSVQWARVSMDVSLQWCELQPN